jgi:hypothetical protein
MWTSVLDSITRKLDCARRSIFVCGKKGLSILKMIPEPSSLVANILLKRIETEKAKFEELYADLDILEKRNLLNKRWKILNSNF